MSRLNRIILFVRGTASPPHSGSSSLLPEKTLAFYANSLRLPLSKSHPSWAEFATSPPIMIASSLDPSNFPPLPSSSSSPPSLPPSIYSLSVPPGLTLTDLLSACLQGGASLDGPIQHKAFGAVAVIVCPEGLHRFAIVSEDET